MSSANTASGSKQAAGWELEGDHTSFHRKFLSERLEGMFNVKELSDITFIVDEDVIYAIRAVLVAASDYFKAMLIGDGFKEKAPGTPIEIHGVDKPTFVICLRFLYSGTAELSCENVVAVLRAADMFRIDTLCTACVKAMIGMVDVTTCLRFLSALDGLPKFIEPVRPACLKIVEDFSLEAFSGDAVSDVKCLSLGTMLDVCASVGRGLLSAPPPPSCLRRVMDAVLAWAQLYYRCPDLTLQGLCGRMESESWFSPSQQLEKQVHEIRCSFNVTGAQLSEDAELQSGDDEMAGYKFSVFVSTNDRESDHFGVYLCPKARDAYPTWWPCILAAQFIGSPGSGEEFRDEFAEFLDTCRYFGGDSRSFGCRDLISHSSLPDVSLAGRNSSGQDVSVSLDVTVKVIFDSLTSLCVAHAFFRPELWSTLSSDHLLGMLHLDETPFDSEDALLAALLSLDLDDDSLQELLQHVRWQFLLPPFLLEACRRRDAGPFRTCAATRDALIWLLGEGEKPEEACERRRMAYKPEVRDCRPIMQAELVGWLLDNPCEPGPEVRVHLAEARAQALEERVCIAEVRAQAAEERARKAEAGIPEGDARSLASSSEASGSGGTAIVLPSVF